MYISLELAFTRFIITTYKQEFFRVFFFHVYTIAPAATDCPFVFSFVLALSALSTSSFWKVDPTVSSTLTLAV